MYIREIGSMIKQKVKVYTSIKTELHTLANGSMISNMATVMKNGQMEHNMREIMFRD